MLDIELKECNIPAHIDVEDDIKRKRTGQVTFTLRINAGVIVDYNNTQYVDAQTKYLGNGAYAEFRLGVKRTTKK